MKKLTTILITAGLSLAFNITSAHLAESLVAAKDSNYDYTTPQAAEHANAVWEASEITALDLRYILLHRGVGWNLEGFSEEELDTIYDKGDHYVRGQVLRKREDYDLEKWTEEMLRTSPARSIAVSGPSEFRTATVNASIGTGQATNAWMRIFKTYRAGLSNAQKVAVTEAEIEGLRNTVNRNSAQDRWLTELSADLMSYRLDQ